MFHKHERALGGGVSPRARNRRQLRVWGRGPRSRSAVPDPGFGGRTQSTGFVWMPIGYREPAFRSSGEEPESRERNLVEDTKELPSRRAARSPSSNWRRSSGDDSERPVSSSTRPSR